MQLFIILLFQVLAMGFTHANNSASTDFFGVSLGWQTTKSSTKAIDTFLTSKRESYHATFDPDCYYKKEGNTGCGKGIDKDLLKRAESFAAEIREETGGAFEITAKKENKEYRDFGGIAQGMILEEIARQTKEPWAGNFAGDMFISDGFNLASPIILSDPVLPGVAFAVVEMKSGWIMSSYAPSAGGSIRDPNSKIETDYTEFKKITLVAKSGFNGARLDGWSTAIMAGGQTTLTKLMNLKKYSGQWGFVVFDDKLKPRCSHNLKCQFGDPRTRKVEVKWQN